MEYLIKTESIGGMSEEQFFMFCQENKSLNLERNANGEIIISEPTAIYMGMYNSRLSGHLFVWNEKHQLGETFDSNVAFTLPNKAIRSPDCSFINKKKWKNIPEADRRKFGHVCPDFVIELLSESDNPKTLQDKMKEWIDNGCQLAWMINPPKKETMIYRKKGEIEIRSFDSELNSEDVLPGFTIDLSKIFADNN